MIVFVSGEDSVEPGPSALREDAAADEKPLRAYDRYVRERLQGTEYLHLMIGLRYIQNSLKRIRDSWQEVDRGQALSELESLLHKQHELEWQAERIKDVFIREYIYGQLDGASSSRRYLAEEARWDIESGRGTAPRLI